MNRAFRNKFDSPRLSPDAAARQGRATSLALAAFPDVAATMAFLNTADDHLGGRPIDLAVESDEGLARVEQALAMRSTPR